MEITDRSKDVIKSGGEWVSSIDVENAASDHPDVAMAAYHLIKTKSRNASPQNVRSGGFLMRLFSKTNYR